LPVLGTWNLENENVMSFRNVGIGLPTEKHRILKELNLT